VQNFLKIPVWRRAHGFRLRMHRLVQRFPAVERYDLTQQLRRSSRSIATNIAESSGYKGELDSARYLQMSVGSCCETLDHLILSGSLGYVDRSELRGHARELGEIRRMLIGWIKKIRGRNR
jgi:four helix bundle protein